MSMPIPRSCARCEMGKFRKTFFRKIRGHKITQLFARDGTK